MAATLERTAIFMTSKEVFEEDAYWWVAIEYSDGGSDEYGPFNTQKQAEAFI